MLSITPRELQLRLLQEDILLIDVREATEHEDYNIGGLLIPLNTLFENISLIPRDKTVVVYCRKGIRSQIAIQRLQQKSRYPNLINLRGGMIAWKNETTSQGAADL